MLNLVLYSDQIIPENEKVDRELLAMLAGRRRIGYVPSGPDPGFHFYEQKRAYYARHDLALALSFDFDRAGDPTHLDELFSNDAIHLSGGNTYAFLCRLNAANLLDRLRQWATDGGILIGTSAGAILMAPTIAVDALFSGNRPEVWQGRKALNLLPFEFFPHFGMDPCYMPALLRYSRTAPHPILACRDGDGVVLSGSAIKCLGEIVAIRSGAIVPSSDAFGPA